MSKEIIQTANFNTLNAVCKEALSKSKFIGVVGFPGAGKSTALKSFVSGKENVIYVRAKKTMQVKDFFRTILFEMGDEGADLKLSLFQMVNRISHKLNYDDTRKLLIVDEAGKFKSSFFEYLHELRDNTENTTGMIIAGPEYFHDKFKFWKSKNVQGVPELYRRINHWQYLDRPTKDEVKAFCVRAGINDKEFINELYRTAEHFAEIVDRIEEYLQMNGK